MNIALKPCPCGKLPDVYFRTKRGTSPSYDAGYICVICKKCNIRFESSNVESGTSFYRLLAGYEEITEKWNKRCGDEA